MGRRSADRGRRRQYLGGVDDLPGIVAEFAPGPQRRLGVLVDHLVAGVKARIAGQVGAHRPARTRWWSVILTSTSGGRQAERLNFERWPVIPRNISGLAASVTPWTGRTVRRPTSLRPGRSARAGLDRPGARADRPGRGADRLRDQAVGASCRCWADRPGELQIAGNRAITPDRARR